MGGMPMMNKKANALKPKVAPSMDAMLRQGRGIMENIENSYNFLEKETLK